MVAWEAHALRMNITVAEVCGRGASLPCGRQEAESEEETGDQVYLGHEVTCSYLLSPAELHLLKFLEPPKMALPVGTKYSTHEPGGIILCANQSTVFKTILYYFISQEKVETRPKLHSDYMEPKEIWNLRII
jgi:hypothetical protein